MTSSIVPIIYNRSLKAFDANGKTITNLADPVHSSDVVTLNYFLTYIRAIQDKRGDKNEYADAEADADNKKLFYELETKLRKYVEDPSNENLKHTIEYLEKEIEIMKINRRRESVFIEMLNRKTSVLETFLHQYIDQYLRINALLERNNQSGTPSAASQPPLTTQNILAAIVESNEFKNKINEEISNSEIIQTQEIISKDMLSANESHIKYLFTIMPKIKEFFKKYVDPKSSMDEIFSKFETFFNNLDTVHPKTSNFFSYNDKRIKELEKLKNSLTQISMIDNIATKIDKFFKNLDEVYPNAGTNFFTNNETRISALENGTNLQSRQSTPNQQSSIVPTAKNQFTEAEETSLKELITGYVAVKNLFVYLVSDNFNEKYKYISNFDEEAHKKEILNIQTISNSPEIKDLKNLIESITEDKLREIKELIDKLANISVSDYTKLVDGIQKFSSDDIDKLKKLITSYENIEHDKLIEFINYLKGKDLDAYKILIERIKDLKIDDTTIERIKIVNNENLSEYVTHAQSIENIYKKINPLVTYASKTENVEILKKFEEILNSQEHMENVKFFTTHKDVMANLQGDFLTGITTAKNALQYIVPVSSYNFRVPVKLIHTVVAKKYNYKIQTYGEYTKWGNLDHEFFKTCRKFEAFLYPRERQKCSFPKNTTTIAFSAFENKEITFLEIEDSGGSVTEQQMSKIFFADKFQFMKTPPTIPGSANQVPANQIPAGQTSNHEFKYDQNLFSIEQNKEDWCMVELRFTRP